MKCPVCGSKFTVLWPNQWRYKRDNKFLCSYTCMRRMDKGEITMEKFTNEQKQEAVRIALDGGDPKAYLRSIGSKNPDNMWYYLKACLRKKDPETYEKLAKTTKAKTVETPEGEFAKVKIDGPINIKTETPEMVNIEQIKRVYPPAEELFPEFEHRITGIETQVGDFQYFRKSGYLDWTPNDGNGTVSMTVEEWKDLLKLMPKIAKRLGVEL